MSSWLPNISATLAWASKQAQQLAPSIDEVIRMRNLRNDYSFKDLSTMISLEERARLTRIYKQEYEVGDPMGY